MSRQDEVAALLDDAMRRAGQDKRGPDGRGTGAQPAPRDPVRVGSVVLAVRDLAATERFYREVVGLQAVSAGGEDAVALGADGVALLTLQHQPGARPGAPDAAGLFHTAFLLPSRADLGAWLWHAGRRGQRLDGAADHLVSEAVYLHDPEGNGVEIYADRPRDAWAWRNGSVVMQNRNPDFAGIMSAAAASQGWAGVPPGTRVGHVHLRVGDVAAARAFWTEAVGLQVTVEGEEAVFLSSGGYHHHIACNIWGSRGAGPRDLGRAGLRAVRLEAEGAAPRVLHDPWGTRIEVSGG